MKKTTNDSDGVVYWSTTPAQGDSPYVGRIVGGLRERQWRVEAFSLQGLARTRNQILHVQWPEHVSRGTDRPRTWAKHVRATMLLGLIRVRKHKVVLTAHNRAPHAETDAFDAWFRTRVHRLADVTVVLVSDHERELRQAGLVAPGTEVRLLAHPTIPTLAAPVPSSNADALVVLGKIHPYHLIEPFLDALDGAGNERRVVVVGKVTDEDLARRLIDRAARTAWLEVHAGYVEDDELASIYADAVAIVSLQRNPFNSGGPYAALPIGLPVIMSSSAQAEELSEEFGAEWIYQLPQEITANDVTGIDSWVEVKRHAPDLSRYAIDAVVDSHIELYELLRS